MIRRPPRSTRVRSSAASDVYKRQRFHRPIPQPLLPAERNLFPGQSLMGGREIPLRLRHRFRRRCLLLSFGGSIFPSRHGCPSFRSYPYPCPTRRIHENLRFSHFLPAVPIRPMRARFHRIRYIRTMQWACRTNTLLIWPSLPRKARLLYYHHSRKSGGK